MGDSDRPTETDDTVAPNRRTLLRGIGAGVFAGSVDLTRPGLAVPSTGPAARSAPGASREPRQAANPIPPKITLTVDGEDHVISVQRIVVQGTCDDLCRFLDYDGLDDPQSTHYDQESIDDVAEDAMSDAVNNARDRVDSATGEGREALKPDILQGSDPPVRDTCGDGYDTPQDSNPEANAMLGGTIPNLQYPTPDAGAGAEGTTADQLSYIRDNVEVNWEAVDDADQEYRLTPESIDMSIDVNPEIRVPDWHPTHPLSEECREEWCSFIRFVMDHEKGHARDMIQVAQQVTEELQNTDDWIDETKTESMETKPGVLGTESQQQAAGNGDGLTEPEIEFYQQMEGWLYEYVRRARCLMAERAKEYHDENESAGESMNCEACTECEEYDHRPIADFPKWRISVSYWWRATFDSMDAGTQRVYDIRRQTYHAEFEVEPPGASVFEGVFSFLEGIVSFLNGFDTWLDGLFDPVGIDVNLVPDTFTMGGAGFYQGTADVTATHFREHYIESGSAQDDTLQWSLTRTIASTVGEPDGHATLDLRPDADEYLVAFPGIEASGVSSHWASDQAPSHSRTSVPVVSPDIAVTQSEAGAENSSESTEITFPIEDCRRVLTREIGNHLWAGLTGAQRMTMATSGDGSPIGLEQVSWSAVPVPADEEGEDPDPGHILCP